MASAWGSSWASAWRDAWGAIFADPGAIRGHAHGSTSAVAILTFAGAPEAEAASVGGTPDRKKKRRAGWVYNPLPVIEPARRPVEEAEALLLCNAL